MGVLNTTTAEGRNWVHNDLAADARVGDGKLLPEVQQARSARTSLINETLEVLGSLRQAMAGAPTPTDASFALADTLGEALTQTDEEYWLNNEGLASEHRFHNKLYYLVRALGASHKRNDADGMCDCIRRLLWVDGQITEEPLLSMYVTGLVLALLTVARACTDYYLIEEAYRIAERCALMLEAKRERRAALKLSPRPDSECWYRLYELVAELKWKGPHAQCDRMISPDDLIDDFVAVEDRCLRYLQDNPSSDPLRNQQVLDALGWVRLQIIKMATLWCQDRLENLIRRFNEIHDTGLSSQVGHFQRPQPGHRDDPWYWDLELFKWCVHGPGSVDEALLCHQWRLDAMRARRSPGISLNAYELGAGRELEYLLSPASTVEVPRAS